MTIVEYRGPSRPGEIRKYLMRRPKAEIVDEYIRIWREFGKLERELEEVRNQAAALAAHVETFHEVMARQKLLWQAEAMDELRSGLLRNCNAFVIMTLEAEANKLRRQAEGGEG